MDLSHWVTSIVAFVRAGYPSGMPATGYAPLVALTRRRLCGDDITAIARNLIARRLWPISSGSASEGSSGRPADSSPARARNSRTSDARAR